MRMSVGTMSSVAGLVSAYRCVRCAITSTIATITPMRLAAVRASSSVCVDN